MVLVLSTSDYRQTGAIQEKFGGVTWLSLRREGKKKAIERVTRGVKR